MLLYGNVTLPVKFGTQAFEHLPLIILLKILNFQSDLQYHTLLLI